MIHLFRDPTPDYVGEMYELLKEAYDAIDGNDELKQRIMNFLVPAGTVTQEDLDWARSTDKTVNKGM